MCGFGSAGTVIPAVSAVTGAVSDKSGTSRANSGIDTSTVNRLGKRNKPIPTQRLIITTVHTIYRLFAENRLPNSLKSSSKRSITADIDSVSHPICSKKSVIGLFTLPVKKLRQFLNIFL